MLQSYVSLCIELTVIYISILYTLIYHSLSLKNNVDYFHGLPQHRRQETKNNSVYDGMEHVAEFFVFVFFSLSLFIVFFFFFCKLRIISKVLSHCLYWFWYHLLNFELKSCHSILFQMEMIRSMTLLWNIINKDNTLKFKYKLPSD